MTGTVNCGLAGIAVLADSGGMLEDIQRSLDDIRSHEASIEETQSLQEISP